MSKSAPPLFPTTPIFIPYYWIEADTQTLTIDYANAHYLRFPSGQGTESIPNLIITSSTTLGTTTVTAPSAGDNSTKVPSTAWVTTALPSTPSLTTTNLANGIASQIPYQSSANTTAFIANGTSGQYLKSNGTSAPAFADISQSLAISNLYTPFYPVSASNGVTNGIIAQTLDPTTCFTTTLSTNNQYFTSIYLYAGSVISNINVCITTSGSSGMTMTMALYTSAGDQVAITASTSANVSPDLIITPFTSAYTVPTTGFYYCGILIASGVTSPTFLCAPNTNALIAPIANYPQSSSITVTATNLKYRMCLYSAVPPFPSTLVGKIVQTTIRCLYFSLN
jgi:hypothetical protein